MENLILKVQKRELLGKKVKILREKNLIPAVIYGPEIKNQNLAIDYLSFEKIYKKAGESSLVDLVVDNGKPVKTLIQDVQTDPLTGRFIHVDFRQVKMTEKITAEILLKFIGEARAVKELDGILIKSLDKIRIKCLPQDLVHEIEVDISSLDTFEDVIYVKDLKLPAGLEILENPNEPVVNVIPPRSEEELKALEEKVEEKIEEVKIEAEEKKKEREAREIEVEEEEK